MKINYYTLMRKLTEEHDYTPYEAKDLIKRVRKMQPEFKRALADALVGKYGALEQIEVSGITAGNIMEKLNTDVVQAFAILNEIKAKPQIAYGLLCRPHDTIVIDEKSLDDLKEALKEQGIETEYEFEEDTSDINIETDYEDTE